MTAANRTFLTMAALALPCILCLALQTEPKRNSRDRVGKSDSGDVCVEVIHPGDKEKEVKGLNRSPVYPITLGEFLEIPFDPEEISESVGGASDTYGFFQKVAEYINKSKKAKARVEKKFNKAKIEKCLSAGVPMLVEIFKDPRNSRTLEERNAARLKAKSPAEFKALLAQYPATIKKAKNPEKDFPRFLVGFNGASGEYAILRNNRYDKEPLWYSEKEFKDSLSWILYIDLSD